MRPLLVRLPSPNLLDQIRAEQARRSLHSFVRHGWHVVEPNMPFIDNWHIGAICEHLEAVTREEIQRLLINIPPGHAKSLLVSVFWPAWVWVNNPSWRGIFSSYAGDLAIRDSVKCRSLIESPWYQNSFTTCVACLQGETTPHDCKAWSLASDQNVKSFFKNTRTGERMSLSVGSKTTGFRGDTVVCDDPLNVTDASSKLERDKAIFWWLKAMSSRLNDQRRGARVMIMQRVSEDDPSGHLIDLGGYEHLCLPSEYEPKRKSITFITKHEPETCTLRQESAADLTADDELDDLGTGERVPVGDALDAALGALVTCSCPRHKFWEDPRTKAGALLFKRLFPAPVLAQARRDLGSEAYAGQHQQRPSPEDGEKFKKAWWRFFKPDGRGAEGNVPRPEGCWAGEAVPLPEMHRIILSLDASFKDTDGTDFVVFQVWGCNKADRFLLDQSRARRSFTATLAEFRRLTAKWPAARKKIVEDKANGSAIIDTLKSEIAGIVAVNPEGGKEARAAAVQPQVESGNVYLPEGAPWLDDFIAEFTAFPNGKHDDQVDALSQALLELADSTGMSRARGMANM